MQGGCNAYALIAKGAVVIQMKIWETMMLQKKRKRMEGKENNRFTENVQTIQCKQCEIPRQRPRFRSCPDRLLTFRCEKDDYLSVSLSICRSVCLFFHVMLLLRTDFSIYFIY